MSSFRPVGSRLRAENEASSPALSLSDKESVVSDVAKEGISDLDKSGSDRELCLASIHLRIAVRDNEAPGKEHLNAALEYFKRAPIDSSLNEANLQITNFAYAVLQLAADGTLDLTEKERHLAADYILCRKSRIEEKICQEWNEYSLPIRTAMQSYTTEVKNVDIDALLEEVRKKNIEENSAYRQKLVDAGATFCDLIEYDAHIAFISMELTLLYVTSMEFTICSGALVPLKKEATIQEQRIMGYYALSLDSRYVPFEAGFSMGNEEMVARRREAVQQKLLEAPNLKASNDEIDKIRQRVQKRAI